MLPTSLLHFGVYSVLFMSLLTAQAAPRVKKPKVRQSSNDRLKNLAKLSTPEVPNPRVEELTTFDPSCKPDSPQKEKVRKAFSDAYYMAEIAQYITKDDRAFKNYFLPDNPEKPNAISKVLKKIVQDPKHVDDGKMVPNMFKSILSGGVSGNKAPHRINNVCSTKRDPRCEDTFAYVRRGSSHPSTIYWCPDFFKNMGLTKFDLSDKKFDLDGWCKGPPHILGDLMTTADTVLHEMTHISFVISHALTLSVGEETIDAGTLDVSGEPDENNKNNYETYKGFDAAAARMLRKRWSKYNAQTGLMKHLKKPPVATSNNAESYAAGATEFFFYVMCAQHGFNPKLVEAREE